MTEGLSLFLVDDDADVLTSTSQSLSVEGYDVRCFSDAGAALADLRKTPGASIGAVITDLRMPGIDGREFLKSVKALDDSIPVIIVTAHGDIPAAVEAMRHGAQDFLEKPFARATLLDVIAKSLVIRRLHLENRSLRREVAAQADAAGEPGPKIVGKSQVMRDLRHAIAEVGATDVDVLILGETGTGKELVARALHARSPRGAGNFVAINCGAVPEQLFESEIFGHEAGAFTSAQGRHIGKFEHASGGTLFLDEVEAMPLAMQVKVLRVLQERVVERLGSNKAISIDTRIVSATKVRLEEEVDAGRFRQDLLYRLNMVVLPIPPLRDRREDIPLLFQHFVIAAASRLDRDIPDLPDGLMNKLLARDWPGNVRELRNEAERFVMLQGSALRALSTPDAPDPKSEKDAGSLAALVADFERSVIGQHLATFRGNVSETAEKLGVSRKTLYKKMRDLGLDGAGYR